MKKIILFSVVFGLITNAANATYYKTSTNTCDTANMLAELDRATALHRAVVTEIDCEYTVPTRPAPSFVPEPKPMPKPAPKRVVAAKKFTNYQVREYKPVVVTYVPTVTVVTVTEQEICTCCDCGC